MERILLNAQSQVQAFERDTKSQAPTEQSTVSTFNNVCDFSSSCSFIVSAPPQGSTASETSEVKDLKKTTEEIHDGQAPQQTAPNTAQDKAIKTKMLFEQSQKFPPPTLVATSGAQTFMAGHKEQEGEIVQTQMISSSTGESNYFSTQVSQSTTTSTPSQRPSTLLINSNPAWCPFLVTLAPGGYQIPIQLPNNIQQHVLVPGAGVPSDQVLMTVGNAASGISPHYALQMHPIYLTPMLGNNSNASIIAGLNPIIQIPVFSNNTNSNAGNNASTMNAVMKKTQNPTRVIRAVYQNNFNSTSINKTQCRDKQGES